MDFSRLKSLEKKIEILSVIEKASRFGGDFWQTGFAGREIFAIAEMSTDLQNENFILKTSSRITIDPQFPVFVRLNYRNTIFKIDPQDFQIMGNNLICKYPDEARAIDPRGGSRYVLPFEQNISLSLKRAGRSIADNAALEIEVRIIDVSESGFGIMISSANRNFLRPFDHFWVKAVDQLSLKDDLFGTVTYVSAKDYSLKRHDVRVGLKLASSLSWDTFDYLKKKCKVILTA